MKRIDSHECPANEDSSAVGVKEVCENAAHKHTQLYLHKMDTEGKHGWFGVHCRGHAAWGVDVSCEDGTQHKHVGAVSNETGKLVSFHEVFILPAMPQVSTYIKDAWESAPRT